MTQHPDPANWGVIWSRPFSDIKVFEYLLNLELRFMQPPKGTQNNPLGENPSSF
jgi:hypothetical protein